MGKVALTGVVVAIIADMAGGTSCALAERDWATTGWAATGAASTLAGRKGLANEAGAPTPTYSPGSATAVTTKSIERATLIHILVVSS
jgi:hypothetical protein